MSSTEKECTTPQGYGDGDGIRQNVSARKRVPISSARKFNARAPRDETLKLKLKTALDEMCATKKQNHFTPNRHQKCLVKSASVAEITPTKTKAKRRSSIAAPEDSCELYATPRPLDDAPKIRFCPKERTKCRIYKRLMLLAWRRARASLLASDNLVKKQDEQINQMERQVDVLNQLRTAEGQRRDETLVECHKFKKAIDILEFENNQLNEETQNLQSTLEMAQNELKMAKSENNFLSEQTIKMQDIVSKKKVENKSLEEKIRIQEEEISSQKVTIAHFEEKFKSFEKNIQNVESNYRIKERKYAQLKCEFKKQMDEKNSLSTQIKSLRQENTDIFDKVNNLESQLNNYIQSCEVLKGANEELTQEIEEISMVLDEEKKQTWMKNTKQMASLSLSALHRVAYIMLPAFLDAPQ